MGQELNDKLVVIEQEIYAEAGETFNINSPKQLGVILFDKLGLPVIKKTKTGYSTRRCPRKLQSEHAIIEHILLYRQLEKLQSTYIEGLLKEIHVSDSKVHTRFQQALTATGRFKLNRSEFTKHPNSFGGGPQNSSSLCTFKRGLILFSADYSQIELRVLAHMSEDKNLLRLSVKEWTFIHVQLWMYFMCQKMRLIVICVRAEAVNFGIVYGISDYGLS